MNELTSPADYHTPANTLVDLLLMSRITAREEAALSELYARYAARLYGLIVRMIADRLEAEEVLMDVFYEVWDRPTRYDVDRGCLTTYLMTLARSRSIDKRRRRSSRPDTDPTRAATLAEADTANSDSHSPLAGMLFDEQSARIRQALAVLDPSQRSAIEMAYFEGLTHSDIANRLDLPLGTIKTLIRQGLFKLRNAVGPTEPG